MNNKTKKIKYRILAKETKGLIMKNLGAKNNLIFSYKDVDEILDTFFKKIEEVNKK